MVEYVPSELFMDQKEILSNISARSDVLDLYPSFLLLEAGIFLHHDKNKLPFLSDDNVRFVLDQHA
jgi:hypothetical protein